MKHFIYTYKTDSRKNHATLHKVRIYRIKHGLPHLVAEGEDTFVSEFQLVMMLMRAKQLLPRRVFEPGPCGGFRYNYSSHLEEEGIASVRRVG